jgi:hypothetical protein
MSLTDTVRRRLVIGGTVLALLTMAGAVTTIATRTTSAQTPPTPTAPAGGKFGSNEDPTHEQNESAEHEAAEDSGTGHRGGMGSNEDAAHEKGESAEREAAENARGTAPTKPGSSTPAQ